MNGGSLDHQHTTCVPLLVTLRYSQHFPNDPRTIAVDPLDYKIPSISVDALELSNLYVIMYSSRADKSWLGVSSLSLTGKGKLIWTHVERDGVSNGPVESLTPTILVLNFTHGIIGVELASERSRLNLKSTNLLLLMGMGNIGWYAIRAKFTDVKTIVASGRLHSLTIDMRHQYMVYQWQRPNNHQAVELQCST